MDSKEISWPIRWSSAFFACMVLTAIHALHVKGPCYKDLDLKTRHDNWKPKFNLFWILKPQCPGDIGTTFTLFIRSNPNGESVRVFINKVISNSYGVNKDTKVIIHGWGGNGSQEWVINVKNAFLSRMDANVIVVDWRKGAMLEYNFAAPNTLIVGLELAYLIKTIIANNWNSAGKFHLIGHSLGAQIAGFTGERIRGIRRITGLDPASPLFKPLLPFVSGPDSGRLDCTDAQFVDIIHSETTFLGIRKAIGHLDFYPNAGFRQPGCTSGGQLFDWCSHSRSVAYFLESINPSLFCTFTAALCNPFEMALTRKMTTLVLTACCRGVFTTNSFNAQNILIMGRCNGNIFDSNSFATMGFDADKYTGNLNATCGKREFYLKTRSSAPYCCFLGFC